MRRSPWPQDWPATADKGRRRIRSGMAPPAYPSAGRTITCREKSGRRGVGRRFSCKSALRNAIVVTILAFIAASAAGLAGRDHGFAVLGAIQFDFLFHFHGLSPLSRRRSPPIVGAVRLRSAASRSNGARFRPFRPRPSLPASLGHLRMFIPLLFNRSRPAPGSRPVRPSRRRAPGRRSPGSAPCPRGCRARPKCGRRPSPASRPSGRHAAGPAPSTMP